jgi:predicted enzyme related to lactoylglutathione lyase
MMRIDALYRCNDFPSAQLGSYPTSGNATPTLATFPAAIVIYRFVHQLPSPATRWYPYPVMQVKALTPILNVSDIAGTVAWFEKWGWNKLWDWGTPPTFGAVGSGTEVCVFLCQDAQGGRGRGANTTTFQQDGDEQGDKGVWMSVWVDDVDAMHQHCVAAGLEVTFPPTDMPWKVREMHLRHPDGHVFRVGRGLDGNG